MKSKIYLESTDAQSERILEKHIVLEPNQEIKADAGKPRLSLVPSQIIRDIAEVREYGLKKYGDSESWRRVELERYIDAAYRHFIAFVENRHSIDRESGIEHYKHLACNIAFICYLMAKNKEGSIEKKGIGATGCAQK